MAILEKLLQVKYATTQLVACLIIILKRKLQDYCNRSKQAAIVYGL